MSEDRPGGGSSSPDAAPSFGQADLSNCEREQIHLAGSIQPHGALMVLHDGDYVVRFASANAAAFLELEAVRCGMTFRSLAPLAWERVHPCLDTPLDTVPLAIRAQVGRTGRAFDLLLHRLADRSLVIEFERAGPSTALAPEVEGALQSIMSATSLSALCDETARLFKRIAGYDRVMVYRFDQEGHGEVFSEVREEHLEPYLGNRYPRSDIPQIARRLYERNRIRVLVDVDYRPVPIMAGNEPVAAEAFDMSLCFLRSMSPIHIQYLKNMGVSATLVASIVVGNKLWGLIACHHYSPRTMHYECRVVCELLAETLATRITALEGFAQTQAELAVRRIEQRMIDSISREGEWQGALFDKARSVLQPLDAQGAALLIDGQVITTGEVPATQQLREIGAWLDGKPRFEVFSTSSLGLDEPRFAPLIPFASGLVAVPVSTYPGEYLLWFRAERVRTLTWGGNPFKPVEIGSDPADLSPRRSFSQWHQLVEATSDPWTASDITAARLIGGTVEDVVLQFRSVRLLIAQDQLAQVTERVAIAEHPVVIADAGGRIILSNRAFQGLLSEGRAVPGWLEELPALFADGASLRRSLHDLVRHRRAWSGDVEMPAQDGRPERPFLMRADPVFSTPDHVLGFVVLFNDLSEQRIAEAARRRFQEGIVGRHRKPDLPLDSRDDLVYRNLLASAVGNAQLAALEITDSIDSTRMPEMLDSIGQSLERTDQLLRFLLWHSAGGPAR